MTSKKKKKVLRHVSTDKHPLLAVSNTVAKAGKKKVSSKTFIDPLQMTFESNDLDLTDDGDMNGSANLQDQDLIDSGEQWKKLVVIANENNGSDVKIEVPSPLDDLLQAKSNPVPLNNTPDGRLQWLENMGGQQEKSDGLNHAEFISFIETCHRHLLQSWQSDQRVKVVKTVVQLSKMLSCDTSGAKNYYPIVFFSITELITEFGRLVFDRLVSKSPQLRVNFNFEDVSSQAQELCKNWFYKIASVRGIVYYMIATVKLNSLSIFAELDKKRL